MNLPDKVYVKRGEVRSFLGISQSAMTKLVRSGVLTPKYFPGMKYAFFERSEVMQIKAQSRERIGKI